MSAVTNQNFRALAKQKVIALARHEKTLPDALFWGSILRLYKDADAEREAALYDLAAALQRLRDTETELAEARRLLEVVGEVGSVILGGAKQGLKVVRGGHHTTVDPCAHAYDPGKDYCKHCAATRPGL